MSKRITTAAALLGAAGLFSGCNFAQPSAGCQVQDSTLAPWQAGYTLTNPADESKSCGKLTNEAIGVFKYLDPASGKSYLAIRPESAAALTSFNVVTTGSDGKKTSVLTSRVIGGDPKENAKTATALSSLADEPDAQALCGASAFTGGTVNVRAVTVAADKAEEDLPAATAGYSFQNVLVYSAASAPGTQLEGTLKYSDGPGCEVEYKVRAFWPQTACDLEAFAKPTEENSALRCAEDSGLNPDFDAVCEESFDGDAYCVPNPARNIPFFKP